MTRTESFAGAEELTYLIIGSGFAGIGMSTSLKRSGEDDFLVIERGDDVGGTWRDNHYPGAACDVPSHLYSFSFRLNPNWSRVYSPQAEIHAYLRETAAEEGLLPHMRFKESLEKAEWLDEEHKWLVETNKSRYFTQFLITATGHLSDAKYPDIVGINQFAGELFHSADWDHSTPLEGQRIGIIGSGASAIQIVPEMQKVAGQLVVFQRSAPYVTPRHDGEYSEETKRSFARAPELMRQLRSDYFWANEARFVERQAVPRLLEEVSRSALAHLEAQVSDPVLRAKLTPDYAIGCKRILKSSDFYPALTQPNVLLETGGIACFDESGVITEDGTKHELDVVILATGFEASDLPVAHLIKGKNDTSLAEQWESGMQAYATTAVHNFPNLFVMNGPNSGLGHNSIVYIIESQIDYIMGALNTARENGIGVLEVTHEAEESYAKDLDSRSQGTVWLTGGCHNWYVDPRNGRLTTVWPDFAHTFREENAQFSLEPYVTVEAKDLALI